jgi:hypothetical protein
MKQFILLTLPAVCLVGILFFVFKWVNRVKKEFVYFYAKIYTDNFPPCPWKGLATGEEVFNFLMSDAGQQFDEDDNIIPGDKIIWYLGCCEKFGSIEYGKESWSWDFAEATFPTVRYAIEHMYQDEFFTKDQYQKLMEAIDEGEKIDNMYEIANYLKAKSEGKKWVKSKDFRPSSKEFFAHAKDAMEKKGWKFIQYGGKTESN